MKYIICGGTGLVGDALVDYLLSKGHEVVVYSRARRQSNSPGMTYLTWKPETSDFEHAPKADVLINLAGATVGQRWTKNHKKSILKSRLDATFLALTIAGQASVGHVVQASATGIYKGGEELMTESSDHDLGFLGGVVKSWEKEARIANLSGISMTILRIGIVLSPDGGMLGKLFPIYKAGFGGPISSKRQWLSWVHITDVVTAIVHSAENQLQDDFNLVAPEPILYSGFSRCLARGLKRPHFMPAPPLFLLRWLLGGFADELVKSYRVSSQKLQATGFQFRFGNLESALKDLLSQK